MNDREVLDVETFIAESPWPERLLMHGPPLERLWWFDLPCSASALWPYVTDTSRLNRALSLPEMRFEERDGVRYGSARYGGMACSWIEEPWEWTHETWVHSVRVYERGFAHVSRAIVRLDPLPDGGTRYYAYFGMVPRGLIGRIWTLLGLRSLAGTYRGVIEQIGAELAEAARARPPLLAATAPHLSLEGRTHLDQLATLLRGKLGESDALSRLLEHVATADDMDAYRLQVPALARRWGVDEQQLLSVCLHATRTGLLEMTWDIICPHCRGVRQEAPTLGSVPSSSTCEVCDIDFATDRDNAIEITFHVHPSIRDVPKRYFCSAEPASKEHIKLQRKLAPGAELALVSRMSAGRYRMRLRGQERYRFLDVVNRSVEEADNRRDNRPDGPAGQPPRWRAGDDGDLATHPDEPLLLHNDTATEQTFVVESMQWLDLALRPQRLFNLQEFRDLFSEQYLGADVQLSVGTQAILFTDMVGSTRFYASLGDPDAFAAIKRHFMELYDIVGRHHGAVVKTLGDAIMAAFSSGLDAIRAAKEIHECFHEQRADSRIRLRISVNVGPCIAVNLNSNIDYFGGTVNIAAKLQACAEGGDIAMTGSAYESDGVREYLADRNARITESTYRSASLDRDIPVYRWSTFERRLHSLIEF